MKVVQQHMSLYSWFRLRRKKQMKIVTIICCGKSMQSSHLKIQKYNVENNLIFSLEPNALNNTIQTVSIYIVIIVRWFQIASCNGFIISLKDIAILQYRRKSSVTIAYHICAIICFAITMILFKMNNYYQCKKPVML